MKNAFLALEDPEPSAPVALLEAKPFPGFSYSSPQEWGSDTGVESCLSGQSRLCSRLQRNEELRSKCRKIGQARCICLRYCTTNFHPPNDKQQMQKMLERKKYSPMVIYCTVYRYFFLWKYCHSLPVNLKVVSKFRIQIPILIYENLS